MNKFFLFFFIFCFGCAEGYKITHTDIDRSIKFNNYKYFAWIPENDTCNNQYDNYKFRQAFIKDFSNEMIKRGYILKTATPDILIQLQIYNVEQKKTFEVTYEKQSISNMNEVQKVQFRSDPELNSKDYGNPNQYYYWTDMTYACPNSPCYSANITQQEKYIQNSITINIIDKKNRQIIWTSTAEADLYNYNSVPFNPYPLIRELLKSYPIKKGNWGRVSNGVFVKE